MTPGAARSAFGLLDLQNRSASWRIGAVVAGALSLAVASYISVPMIPVPVTMQSFAVLLVGALYGWRLGALTIVAWLGAGAAGLPVLAGGAAGLPHFMGTTAGYLFAFPVAGALTGWLAGRGWNGSRVGLAFANMLLGHAVCLMLGAAWLAMIVGAERAFVHGVLPFLVGAVLKSALGAAVLKLVCDRKVSPRP